MGGGGGDNSSDNSELLKVTEQYLDFRSMDVTFDMSLFFQIRFTVLPTANQPKFWQEYKWIK